jgi:hypothetical protein
MVSNPIHVANTTNLDTLLDDATDAPVRLERDGIVFRLSRDEPSVAKSYDPEALRSALRSVAGSISPDEALRLKKEVRRGRNEGSRPVDRP